MVHHLRLLTLELAEMELELALAHWPSPWYRLRLQALELAELELKLALEHWPSPWACFQLWPWPCL